MFLVKFYTEANHGQHAKERSLISVYVLYEEAAWDIMDEQDTKHS